MAGELDVDLVEIAATANPPVCRLMDYGKFKYQEQKRAAEAKAKQTVIEIKEVKFRPGTDDGDYNIKMRNIRFVETSEAKIWKDTTCPSGLAVFGTLVLGAHAYGVTELEGGGLEHIVKQLGYGDDPLNQRASVGWKGMRAAERLVEQYMVRIESVSSYSENASAN